MKLKPLLIATALAACATGPVMAASCTSTYSLGTLGAGSFSFFNHYFDSAGSFNDCYNFTLSVAPSSATAASVEWDWSRELNIDLTSASLSGGSLLAFSQTLGGSIWTFGGLSAGDYQLAVTGNVYDTGRNGVDFGVGYAGILTTSGPAVVTPVPEPNTLAMLALGFGAVVWGTRRRKS